MDRETNGRVQSITKNGDSIDWVALSNVMLNLEMFDILGILRNKNDFVLMVKPLGRVQSIKKNGDSIDWVALSNVMLNSLLLTWLKCTFKFMTSFVLPIMFSSPSV